MTGIGWLDLSLAFSVSLILVIVGLVVYGHGLQMRDVNDRDGKLGPDRPLIWWGRIMIMTGMGVMIVGFLMWKIGGR